MLKREEITIRMDGRGRALDNIFVERLWRSVKHEDVYLKGYASLGELTIGLVDYFAFLMVSVLISPWAIRPQHGLPNRSRGGAMIVHRGGSLPATSPFHPLAPENPSISNRGSAEPLRMNQTIQLKPTPVLS